MSLGATSAEVRPGTVGVRPKMGVSTGTGVAMAEILGMKCECFHLKVEGASRTVGGSDDSTRLCQKIVRLLSN